MNKNVLYSPLKASEEEIEALNKRRAMEKQLVLDRDIDSKGSKYWYMISSEWLYQWKCFISNKIKQPVEDAAHQSNQPQYIVRKSQNERIGVLPPGPISNYYLFKRGGEDVKCGLVLNQDYRGVNKEVWSVFHKLYGGGPLIGREQLDIYSVDITKEGAKNKRLSITHAKSDQMSSTGPNAFISGGANNNNDIFRSQINDRRQGQNIFAKGLLMDPASQTVIDK